MENSLQPSEPENKIQSLHGIPKFSLRYGFENEGPTFLTQKEIKIVDKSAY